MRSGERAIAGKLLGHPDGRDLDVVVPAKEDEFLGVIGVAIEPSRHRVGVDRISDLEFTGATATLRVRPGRS